MQMFWVLLVWKKAHRLPVWRLNRLIVWLARWWKVECCMLEHRKACCCTQYFWLYMKKPCATSTPCAPSRSTPTCLLMLRHWPEFRRNLPTRESVYMLNLPHNLYQALEQTGETTRAYRFCLQVLNFLQMEGRSAFYRKFLRISSIKELWAMTRRLWISHDGPQMVQKCGNTRFQGAEA